MNLLVGYTGLVPFGASVFFGCASYAVAFAMLRRASATRSWRWPSRVLFSLLLAAVDRAIILRRRGLYFSLLTLAFSQIAFEIAFKWTDVTGGENGLQGVPRPMFASAWSFHIFAVVTVALGMWLLWRIAHSPFGRALQALRDNEQRVQSLGYNTFRIKFGAFVLMGGVVGYRRRAAGADAAGRLRQQSELAARRRCAADDGAGRRASLPRSALGRHRLHRAGGPAVGDHRKLVADVRADHDAVRARLAGRHPGPGVRAARPRRWTLTRPASRRARRIAPLRGGGDATCDAGQPILAVRGLHKRFGRWSSRADVHLEVHPFRLHSLIGPNGAGKTTFFNMLTGLLRAGRRRDPLRRPRHHAAADASAHPPRHRPLVPDPERIPQPHGVRERARRGAGAEPAAELPWRDAYRLGRVNARTWSMLDAVGLADRAADHANLPHGDQRLLEIAITLATDASCCCSTSRWPASPRPTARWSAR